MRDGVDPSELRKQEKRQQKLTSENTFEAIAREWHSRQEKWTKGHAAAVMRRLERDIFPSIGHRPIAEVLAADLLQTVRQIENRGATILAQRALQTSGQVFRYAIATGRAERDPSPDLRGALKTVKVENRSYLREDELQEFIAKLAAYDGEVLTRLALQMVMLTFVRSSELRGAYWTEFDLKKGVWRIPAERIKMKEEHIVPLASQTIVLIKKIQLHSGNESQLFPNQKRSGRVMSENTLLYAMYRMGYHGRATVHGFRSTASTILHESNFRSDVIERQLAHGERNKVKAAYNHAQYLPERREMMQWWGDYLQDRGLIT